MPKSGLATKTARSIGTNFGTHVQIHLEMAMGKIKITPCDLGGFRGSEIQKSGITAK